MKLESLRVSFHRGSSCVGLVLQSFASPGCQEGMLTKYSIRSSEYMGPIDSSESTM